MGLLRQRHKSAFWSQFLLGLLAFLAWPTSPPTLNEREPTAVAKAQTQSFGELTLILQAESEQAILSYPEPPLTLAQQAVDFCPFLAKPYRLQGVANPPIRAGPCSHHRLF